jgi:KaiC/GvpD/RAD55 family RecA-like ATPase
MRPNFLARRPSGKRLVMAVRGAAGTGKSRFGASVAEAGVGKLCFIDLERKARLIPGATGKSRAFDPFEIGAHELEDFLDWVLEGDGAAEGYEAFVLDSWSSFFGAHYTRALAEASREAGRAVFKLSAEQLQALQVQVQAPLRKLCFESGKSVVIIDHLAAAGKEELEENQVGRVVPISASGLEYLVDAVIRLELRQDAFETRRVATVIKSNIEGLPIGHEVEQPAFADFLGAVGEVRREKHD